MASLFRTCKDGHRCENGSLCAEDPSDEGSYYCDCSTANGDYAGLFCEFEADTYCTFPQEVTSSWFCTNGGTCVFAVDGGKSEWTCDCSDEYEGSVSSNRMGPASAANFWSAVSWDLSIDSRNLYSDELDSFSLPTALRIHKWGIAK